MRELAYNTDPNTISIVGGGQTFTAGFHNQLTGSLTAGTQTSVQIQSLAINGNGPLTMPAAMTLTVSAGVGGGGTGSILKTGGDLLGATPVTISGGSLTTGSTALELIVRTDLASDVLTIASPITNTGAPTKSGEGTLILSGTHSFSGTTFVNGGKFTIRGSAAAGAAGNLEVVMAGGTYELLGYSGADNNTAETAAADKNVTVKGTSTLTVGRLNPLTEQATNKTVTFGGLAIANQRLTTTASDGYGIKFTGTTTFTEALPPILDVAGIQTSNVVPGLTLSGIISSPGPGLIKAGSGTLVLTNSANAFGSTGAQIDIQTGVLAADSNGALGNGNNIVALNNGNPSIPQSSGRRETSTLPASFR